MKILDSISAKVGDNWPAMTEVIVFSAAFAAHCVVMLCLIKCADTYFDKAYFDLPRRALDFWYYFTVGTIGGSLLIITTSTEMRPTYSAIPQYLERMGLVWRLQQDGLALRHSSERWGGDRRVVLIAVQHNGEALRYASQKLQCDREIVLIAVQHNGEALRYASQKLQCDREIVLKAVSQNGQALRYASQKLRCDKEIVLEAVSQNGQALCFAGIEPRRDEEVVFAAVTQTPLAFEHASARLRWNKAFSLEAVCRNRDVLSETLPSFREEFLAMSTFGQERKRNTLLTMNLAQLLCEE